jgi:hypothetical protein
MYVRVCVCVYTYTRIYIYTYIRTYIHTYIQTYTYIQIIFIGVRHLKSDLPDQTKATYIQLLFLLTYTFIGEREPDAWEEGERRINAE